MKSAQEAGQGHFRARALIKNKKTSKSFIVNTSFNIEQGKAIRLDVTSPLNQHLASFLVRPKELSFFNVPEKTYYQGPESASVFSRFMAVPLEPMWLENILFRKPFETKDWSCDNDKSNRLVSCLNRRMRLSVSWEDTKDTKLAVLVTHPQGEIQMNFHRIQPKVEEGVSLTSLEIPKGFRRIK